MLHFLMPLIKEKGPNLTIYERNMLSLAFKDFVSPQLTAVAIISAIGNK